MSSVVSSASFAPTGNNPTNTITHRTRTSHLVRRPVTNEASALTSAQTSYRGLWPSGRERDLEAQRLERAESGTAVVPAARATAKGRSETSRSAPAGARAATAPRRAVELAAGRQTLGCLEAPHRLDGLGSVGPVDRNGFAAGR